MRYTKTLDGDMLIPEGDHSRKRDSKEIGIHIDHATLQLRVTFVEYKQQYQRLCAGRCTGMGKAKQKGDTATKEGKDQ